MGTIPREEQKNIFLEQDMHLRSADVISGSEAMWDYESMHVGEVSLPPPTAEELESMRVQREVVAGLSVRNEMYLKVYNARATVRQTLLTISQKEDIVSTTLQEVQRLRDVRDFDWSLAKNNYVRQLKHQIAEHETQLAKEHVIVKTLLEEAEKNYPDIEFEVKFKFS
jgi:hypothetical protein